MIKIYGSPLSSAGRCYWMMEELGLSYEIMPMDMRNKEHKSEEFLQINPNGKVPAIVDGDLKLWESMAITHYLTKKVPSPLTAQNAIEEGLMMQWSFWALAEFQPPAINWLIQQVFVPDDKRNHQIIEDAKKALPRLLAVLDKSLEGKNHLVGNRFTLADINVGSVANVIKALQFDLSTYPNIQRWMKNYEDRPAFKKLADLRKH